MEQRQGDKGDKKGLSGFSEERINTTDNMMWLPTTVHRKVTGKYARKVPGMNMSFRDALTGEPWDEQYNQGLRAVNEAWEETDENDR